MTPDPLACPNLIVDGPIMQCRLIDGKAYSAPPSRGALCSRCVPEWTDGQPPTCSTLTPTLVRIMPSRGFGDTVAKIANATGIAAAAHLVSRVTGVPCGCAERQARWNAAVPYKTGGSE